MSPSSRPHTSDDRENHFKSQNSLGRGKGKPPPTPRLSSSVRLQHITLPRTSSPSGAIPPATPLKPFAPPVNRLAESTSQGSRPKRQRRILDAEADYLPGDTIMRAPILFAALNSSVLFSHCSGCFQSQQTDDACSFLPCSRCKLVVYCSVVRSSPETFADNRGAMRRVRKPISPNVEQSLVVEKRHQPRCASLQKRYKQGRLER